MAENVRGADRLAEYLGDISPLQPRSSQTASLSLKGSRQDTAGSNKSNMSVDPPRKPFGELQSNFEFKPRGVGAADAKPLAGAYKAQASSMVTPSAAEPTTPMSVMAESRTASESPFSLRSTLLWQSPMHSSIVMVLSGIALAASWFAVFGPHSITLVTAVCYLLMARMAFNFVVFMLSATWHEHTYWSNTDWVLAAANKAAAGVKGLAALHDSLLSAKNPERTLKVALSLYALACLGSMLSFGQLVVLAYLAAFTLPPVYVRYQKQLDDVARAIKGITLDRAEAAHLTLTARLAFSAALLIMGLFWGGYKNASVAVFVVAVYWYTTLNPSQVEQYRKQLAPVTHSVQKASRYMSGKANAMLNHYQASTSGPARRTKSHFSKAE